MSVRPVPSSGGALGAAASSPSPADPVAAKTHTMTLRGKRAHDPSSDAALKARKIDKETSPAASALACQAAALKALPDPVQKGEAAATLIAALAAPIDASPPGSAAVSPRSAKAAPLASQAAPLPAAAPKGGAAANLIALLGAPITAPPPRGAAASSNSAPAAAISSPQPATLPVNRVWEGSVNIKGPDGRWIPVEHPNVTSISTVPKFKTEYVSHYGVGGTRTVQDGFARFMTYYDERDRLILDDCIPRATNIPLILGLFSGVPKHAYDDEKAYRAVEGFDYTPYGLQKIGKVWVDAKNPKAVANAKILAS